MKITLRNVRSVVLQSSLLLIYLSMLRISAQEDDSTLQIVRDAQPHLEARRDELVASTSTIASKTSTITDPTPVSIESEEIESMYYAQETEENDTPIAEIADSADSVEDNDDDDEDSASKFDIVDPYTDIEQVTTATNNNNKSKASSSFTSITSINKSSVNTTLQYTNTSDPLVQYDLECQAEDAFCEKVSRAVGAAIDEFTRVVNIKNSLLIKVTYYSFCEKTCANNTMGWGIPTSQFTLPFEDGADLNYVYPQALAKQLAPYSSTSVWAKYDIEIELNHDVYFNGSDTYQQPDSWNGTGTPPNGKFWFFNDTATSKNSTNLIQAHQVDFRYVVLHELMHGLGFLSSWAAYFWTDASPFRELVEGVIDPQGLQFVTPGPYWYINQDTGPVYVTGFQPTMIFDKYLVNMDTELNLTSSMSDLAFEMQDFCVQSNDAFIVNFIHAFNEANQSLTAQQLWLSISRPETISFQFQPPIVANSSYNLNRYLNQTYQNITLLTGSDVFSMSTFEQMDPTMNRPGLMISHLDEQYHTTPDFLMTSHFHLGKTLEDLTRQFYDSIPVINYNTTASKNNSNTMVELNYTSPIGPGILRILDSLGYSTVLTRTNYTTDGSVKTPKSRSMCDDSNTNHAKPTPTSMSMGNTFFRGGASYDGLYYITSCLTIFLL